jgi:hypothetical protein
MTTTLKPSEIGTLIHGTLRSEDVLPAFADEIERQQIVNGAWLSLPENKSFRDSLENLKWELMEWTDKRQAELNDTTYGLRDMDDDGSEYELWSSACDYLSAFAPQGGYFGAHEGDGSDFGYWMGQED